jgi:hypothetical protein
MLLSILFFVGLPITISHAFYYGESALVHLEKRAPAYGGVALAAPTCPQGLGTCPGFTDKCCPSQFSYCHILGGVTGTACCPDGT